MISFRHVGNYWLTPEHYGCVQFHLTILRCFSNALNWWQRFRQKNTVVIFFWILCITGVTMPRKGLSFLMQSARTAGSGLSTILNQQWARQINRCNQTGNTIQPSSPAPLPPSPPTAPAALGEHSSQQYPFSRSTWKPRSNGASSLPARTKGVGYTGTDRMDFEP